ncbi:MAG TPA: hypothetical protein PK788_02400 [Gemmatimonadaceae bacterium]|nr:hypothetical protein [Gemmatimonadaceae bacterium]HRQ77938.1 hypothetical protein [Gemmatimonadaceae bacterium]
MSRVRLPLALATGAMLAASVACGRDVAQRPDVIRSDSAGVRLITNTAPDTALAWRFDTIGVLTDSLGEPWLFTAVPPRWVITDRAGRTYVLERDQVIRRFGRDGRYERSIGRRGGAPGEMLYPVQLLQQGDSVGVLDDDRAAIVRWGPDLGAIADLPLRGALHDASRVAFRFGGAWVQRRVVDSLGAREELVVDTVANVAVYALPEGRGAMVQACGTRIAFEGGRLFASGLHWHAAAPQMVVSSGADYEIDYYEGPRLFARVKRSLPSRAPTRDDLRRLYPDGLQLRRGGGPPCVIDGETLERDVGFADTMPAVHGVARFREGTLWVRRSMPSERPSVLDVFGTDGTYLGSVRGLNLPVGQLPNDELLVPIDDESSGGIQIARIRVTR